MRQTQPATRTNTTSDKRSMKRLSLSRTTLRTIRGGDGLSIDYASKSTPTLMSDIPCVGRG